VKTLVPDMVPLRGSWLMECGGQRSPLRADSGISQLSVTPLGWDTGIAAGIQDSFRRHCADDVGPRRSDSLSHARRPVRISMSELVSWSSAAP